MIGLNDKVYNHDARLAQGLAKACRLSQVA